MNFKIKTVNFIKFVIGISLSIYLLSFIIIKIIIDPYGDFKLFDFKINENVFLSSKDSPYFLSEKLLNDKFTLIFGTSRSALIDDSIIGDKVLNFSGKIYGNPIDVYSFLINLDKKKIKNINQIYYLLDAHTFESKVSYYKNRVYSHNLLNRLYYSLKSFNIKSFKDTYNSILMNLKTTHTYALKDNGILKHFNKKNDNIINNNFIHIGYPEPIKFSKKAFSSLSKIDIFLKNNRIKIIYFNTPLYNKFIEKMNMKQVIQHAKIIIQNIDYFYDFRCFPDISKLPNKFSNPNHSKYEALEFIFHNMSNDFKVNKNNINVFYKSKWNICIKEINKIKNLL